MPSKNFQKYFMAHQYMPKIFNDPHKNPPALSPTYLMYGPLAQNLMEKSSENMALRDKHLGNLSVVN